MSINPNNFYLNLLNTVKTSDSNYELRNFLFKNISIEIIDRKKSKK
jgi:hypothetical protein